MGQMCGPDPGLCKGRTPCTLEKQYIYVSMNREQQFKNQMSFGCISLVALVSNWKILKTWEEGIFNAQFFLQCRMMRRQFHMTATKSYTFLFLCIPSKFPHEREVAQLGDFELTPVFQISLEWLRLRLSYLHMQHSSLKTCFCEEENKTKVTYFSLEKARYTLID